MFTEGLRNKVVLYIPSTTNIDTPLDTAAADRYTQQALHFLASRFGGATAQHAIGAWVAQDGSLVQEPVQLVYSFARELTSADYQAVYSFAELLRSELQQEAVACEINGELYFI